MDLSKTVSYLYCPHVVLNMLSLNLIQFKTKCFSMKISDIKMLLWKLHSSAYEVICELFCNNIALMDNIDNMTQEEAWSLLPDNYKNELNRLFSQKYAMFEKLFIDLIVLPAEV